MDYRVTDANGFEVFPGRAIISHRDEPAVFRGVERGPMPGKSAKVMVTWDSSPDVTRSYYASVFDLTIEEVGA